MACSQGFDGLLLWLNTFGWVYEPRDRTNPLAGVRVLPMVTWEFQDEALREIYRCVDVGEDLLIDKSRDMTATWDCVAVFAWWWMFIDMSSFLMVSRKEELVDKRGDPRSLFWKTDFLVDHQPSWMKPSYERTYMHLLNTDTGSVIDGESTNVNLGRGDRRRAILLDEFAVVENAVSVLAATADTTDCRIYNSTPNGMGNFDDRGELRGNAFAALRWSGKVNVLSLPWWNHPIKAIGRELKTDPVTGKQRWSSPWYVGECKRRASRREIAQEIDMDYLGSGEMFFDNDIFARIRSSGELREPWARGELDYTVQTVTEGQYYDLTVNDWQERSGGRLWLWEPLRDGKPRVDKNYVGFADISLGTGASNSVFRIATADDREEVAALVTPDVGPEEFARYCVALARWFPGQIGYLFMGWEANGPGEIFGREVWRLGYRYVLGNSNPAIPWNPRDQKIGWYSSGGPNGKKVQLLSELRSAWARGEFITHDTALIGEAEQYITYPNGTPGPSGLVEEAEGARAAHGDRVIGAAGIILCFREQAKYKPVLQEAPEGSMAFRAKMRRQRDTERADRW